MKIISKFKDYYDYLSGIYGVDPLITYNRNPHYDSFGKSCNGFIDYFSNNTYRLIQYRVFYVCDKTYGIVYYNNQIYYTFEEQLHLYQNLKNSYNYYDKHEFYSFLGLVYGYKEYGFKKSKFVPSFQSNNLNKKYNCPIIISSNGNGNGLYFNQRLSDYKFNRIISDKDLYLQITDFLSKKDIEMPSNPDDMIRYEEKGFDKKTSFRKM